MTIRVVASNGCIDGRNSNFTLGRSSLKLGFNYGGWKEGKSERAEYGFAFLLVRRRHLKCAGQQASREMRGETPGHVDVVSNSLKKKTRRSEK